MQIPKVMSRNVMTIRVASLYNTWYEVKFVSFLYQKLLIPLIFLSSLLKLHSDWDHETRKSLVKHNEIQLGFSFDIWSFLSATKVFQRKKLTAQFLCNTLGKTSKKKYRVKSENGTFSLYTPPSPPIKWKIIKWIIEQNVVAPPPYKKVKNFV